ncbi:DNA-directed RNA polymerase III subunit RPC4 [Aplysia californica]|uniref:DNA-directed RNA polymerase III subunit RPC4 n=1 Tax=Aplysia californica TaxID=6500 RepID=A0ABM0JPS7_APLCA|nr:DNA-directed RNA polymerase III subunit RPC4 [Aplysia californica]
MASGSGDGSSNSSDIPRGLINRMGNPVGRGSRLPSVRGHRDLTLGGIQRKVFTPNLAAVKKAASKDEPSKQASAPSSSKSDQTDSRGKGRGRGRSDRGRGRGRGRGEDRTIQLQSEFAYGPMGGQSSGWSRGSGGGGGGGGGAGGSRQRDAEAASFKMSLKQSTSSEDDKKILEALMRDDFVSDISSGDPHMRPVKLPLNCNIPSVPSVKDEIKAEPKEEGMDIDIPDGVKEETVGGPSQHVNPAQRKVKSEEIPTVMSVLDSAPNSEKGELVFIQFPDTLPGIPVLSDDRPKTSTGTSKEDELSQRLGLCQLKDCSEGYVGKLRIRKSGKAELVLEHNTMEVLAGLPANFHQELVSIHTDSNPGQMVALGQVSQKLIVAPDYNSLLQETERF